MKTKYNLPSEVIFCKECVMSNQRPSSIPEFFHTKNRDGAKYLKIDENGICNACNHNNKKKKINWFKREKELKKLLSKYRKNNGEYDCIIPGSGGKDSAFAAHVLKYKYKMNPLLVTWPPILYTDYGLRNFDNWINIGGFDCIVVRPNGKVMKLLTKLSIENLLHPFQTFILGQKNVAPKIATKFNIKLVFYGENEAEYGNPIAENETSIRKNSYFIYKKFNDLYLSGVKIKDLLNNYNLKLQDLKIFLPEKEKEFLTKKIQTRYLGYYLRWNPQEAYYYAAANTGFKPRPFRTQGTYSKYNSVDDKIDDLHYYTTYMKFGLGRASYDASQEIRNGHINRKEAKMLVKKYDGEFPHVYIDEVLNYIDLDKNKFLRLCDKFRSPHLWVKIKNKWKLRHTVNRDGYNDKKK